MVRPEAPPLVLQRMRQQHEVRTHDDDWTGLTDPATRRRLQNRLHQRAYRNRRRAQKSVGGERTSPARRHLQAAQYRDEAILSLASTSMFTTVGPPSPGKSKSGQVIMEFRSLPVTQMQTAMEIFETKMRREYIVGLGSPSPRLDMLITLVQFNIFRALMSNTSALGFNLDWLNDCDAISPFNRTAQGDPQSSLCPPVHLRATELQRTVSHHPWIDLFPLPDFRDNFFRQGEEFDDTSLCLDIVEACHTPGEGVGLIVWGEPSEARNWEVSEQFAIKWGWLLEDCNDLLRSTNSWRENRGEDPIFFG